MLSTVLSALLIFPNQPEKTWGIKNQVWATLVNHPKFRLAVVTDTFNDQYLGLPELPSCWVDSFSTLAASQGARASPLCLRTSPAPGSVLACKLHCAICRYGEVKLSPVEHESWDKCYRLIFPVRNSSVCSTQFHSRFLNPDDWEDALVHVSLKANVPLIFTFKNQEIWSNSTFQDKRIGASCLLLRTLLL